MRSRFLLLLAAIVFLAGCTASDQSSRQARHPILIDEYSLLDDHTAEKPNDKVLQRKLDEARRHYLYALKASEQGKNTIAGKHFEAAMSILNDLVTYPDIYTNTDFTHLSESVIQDYESRISSTDSLDPNSSFFVLRDKMYQEIETIPVERKKYPSKQQLATINAGSAQYDLQIDLTDNTPVQQCISYFTSERGRRFFSRWLGLTGRYFPLYERVLAEEGVPQEIRHLSMIESGLSPKAVSWAKAVGLWQFIPGTGKMYGLAINWWVDERRDPEKATRAAARYLKDLYTDFGDWQLALAAYNCGPGRVKSAIAKANSRDYWVVRGYLPRETQQYVPLFIAATKITMDPEAYGFTDIDYQLPDEYQSVPLQGSFDLATIARAANCSVEELKGLNPELLQDRIPSGSGSAYSVNVPINTPPNLAAKLKDVPAPNQPQVTFVSHKVGRGETLTSIANQYNVTVDAIGQANSISPTSNVRRGATLRVPMVTGAQNNSSALIASNDVNSDVAERNTPPSATSSGSSASTPVRATRSAQASHDIIAPPSSSAPAAPPSTPEERAFVDALSRQSGGAQSVVTGTAATARRSTPAAAPAATPTAAANRRESATPKSEERAKIKNVVHVVTAGETLTGIARKYKVSVSDLASWNDIPKSTSVRTGQKLKVHGGQAESRSTTQSTRVAATTSDRSPSRSESSSSRRVTTTSSRFETHRVRRGESLTSIAERYGVSVNDLKTWNEKNIRGGGLQAGATLKIYSETPAKGDTRRTSRAARSAPKSYTVRRGDSLSDIANRFGVDVKTLRKNNPKVTEKNIRSGQTIRIAQ